MSLSRDLTALPENLGAKYELQQKLGFGSFAVVYQVRHRETGQLFALKVVDKKPLQDRNMLATMHKEIHFLQLHHDTPHVVRLVEVSEADGRFFLCFELCGKNLQEVVSGRPASEDSALEWARQACEGLSGLHAAGVIHRDLKPANLLIDTQGSVRICDFGYACTTNERRSDPAGTREYAAPEIMDAGKNIPQTTAADIYSLGTCLQHFLLGRIPQGPHDMPPQISAETQQLLRWMMQPHPAARPSADELLEHLEPASPGLFGQVWQQGVAFLAKFNNGDDGKDGSAMSMASTFAPSPVLTSALPAPAPPALPSPTSSTPLQPHAMRIMPVVSFVGGHRRMRSTP